MSGSLAETVRKTAAVPQTYDHFIGGALVGPASGAYFESTDPYTGEVWANVARGTKADIYDGGHRVPSFNAGDQSARG